MVLSHSSTQSNDDWDAWLRFLESRKGTPCIYWPIGGRQETNPIGSWIQPLPLAVAEHAAKGPTKSHVVWMFLEDSGGKSMESIYSSDDSDWDEPDSRPPKFALRSKS